MKKMMRFKGKLGYGMNVSVAHLMLNRVDHGCGLVTWYLYAKYLTELDQGPYQLIEWDLEQSI